MTAKKAAAEGVYAIVGADSLLAERALEELLSTRVGEDRSQAVEVLSGDEVSWGRVLDAARSRSLFVTRRAVVVRRAESLKGEPSGLSDLLDAETPGVSLIFMITKVDRRRNPWRELLERARVVGAEPLKGQALRGFVAEELRRRGLRLTPDGLQELIERVGQDLRRLIGEIDKLEAFREGGEALSAEEVSRVLGRGLAQPMYLLSDAVAERDRARTLELLESLIEGGEKAEWILGSLHRSLRQVRATLALQQAGVPREEMARRLGLPPKLAFKLRGLQSAARRWSERDLRAAFRALAGADRQLKLGTDPRLTLGVAVVRVLGEGGASRPASPRGR